MNIVEDKLPKHVAIIMDGNRRWARKQGLSAIAGHDYVAEKMLEPLVDRCVELGIPYLTLWAFSTENWQRDQREVEGMMRIFRKGLQRSAERLFEKGVRLLVIGDIDRFPKDIAEQAKGWVEKSEANKKITVCFGLNYGGRDEILRAVKRMIVAQLRNAASRRLTAPFRELVASAFAKASADRSEGDKRDSIILSRLSRLITEDEFEKYLDTSGMPDPDLIIRTGGEKRLSGFMSWQSAYSELYFPKTLMPEFTIAEFDKALLEYQRRSRRFGK